jgi:hypothetical protein
LRHAGGDPLNTTVTGFLLHGQGGMAGSCCLYLRKP